ncbi:MAG: hypothetical protein WCA81_15080 [Rhizomicrobium sp.]
MKSPTWISIAAAIICVIGEATSAAPSDIAGSASARPLYTAFITFCVETGAVPRTVNAAVQKAGGKPHNPPGCSTEDGTCAGAPFPLTLSSWDVVVGGHRFLVNTGRSWPSRQYPFAKSTPHDFDSCDIHSSENEDASVSAIVDWVGVPGDISTSPPTSKYSPGLKLYFYGFQTIGQKHVSVAPGEQENTAILEGRYWGLVMMQDQKGASLNCTHYLPKSTTSSQ